MAEALRKSLQADDDFACNQMDLERIQGLTTHLLEARMPKGLARTEPTGLWRVGASAAERVQAARRWAEQVLHSSNPLPPFHRDGVAAADRMS